MCKWFLITFELGFIRDLIRFQLVLDWDVSRCHLIFMRFKLGFGIRDSQGSSCLGIRNMHGDGSTKVSRKFFFVKMVISGTKDLDQRPNPWPLLRVFI